MAQKKKKKKTNINNNTEVHDKETQKEELMDESFVENNTNNEDTSTSLSVIDGVFPLLGSNVIFTFLAAQWAYNTRFSSSSFTTLSLGTLFPPALESYQYANSYPTVFISFGYFIVSPTTWSVEIRVSVVLCGL